MPRSARHLSFVFAATPDKPLLPTVWFFFSLPREVSLGDDDRLLVTGSYDKTVRAWDVNSAAEKTNVQLSGMVQALAMSPTRANGSP